MKWKVSHCRACGALIEWVGRHPYDFEGIGKLGMPHKNTCQKPNFFKNEEPKQEIKARERLLKDPWWNK